MGVSVDSEDNISSAEENKVATKPPRQNQVEVLILRVKVSSFYVILWLLIFHSRS